MSGSSARGLSRMRDLPLVGWLVAAVVVALTHRYVPDSGWLMLHLVLLGAVSHAIFVWSFHFAQTLLRSLATDAQAQWQSRRLGLLAAGAVCVVVGVPTTWWPLVLVGGTAVATAVAWHGLVLLRMLRRALPARFRVTVRYYLWASASLVLGAGFGVTLAWGWPDPWQGRLLAAHALTNVLGWVGLTLTGTLLTLWPTMLRTRMDDSAARWTTRALPVFGAGIGVAVTGALVGVGWLSAVGVVLYVAGLGLWGRTLVRPALASPPREFGAASVAAGLVWWLVGLGWAAWLLATSGWSAVDEGFVWPAAVLGGGFAAQILIGALSYLLPSVLGGGPSVVRAGQRWFNAAAGVRLIATNGGLALWLLPTTSWVKVTCSALAPLAAASFLPLMALGIRASIAARRQPAETSTAVPAATPPVQHVFSAGQVVVGLTALMTAVIIGVGLDPTVAVASRPSTVVAATGRVVRVAVTAKDMRFSPAQVHIARGDRLVVELTNADAMTHDLVIGSARTARIAPGAHAELDAGVIGDQVQGFCSVAGHRQQGMVFTVVVDGAPPPATSPMSGMPGMHHPASTPADVVDPVLAPLTADTVHAVTLTVTEVPLEVAPGVWQKRWTYNGSPVGPTLHGRIGDTFVVTLVNNGSMAHSIDFHAGALAPDGPMRSIQPGERLTYRFTATRAGVWMYHCSTMPMSAHIAAGMAGAVVIEPPGLPAVDRSYVLVQSEVYATSRATDASSAEEVDADKAGSAGTPDYVVFNGVANAYDTATLSAKVGERVRFWVLDVGPNRSTSFHVVGAQFDTVFSEGSYLLKNGQGPLGSTAGGSQALGLAPAQGGFVETVFPEAGRYAFVTHVMADAERGAHGFVQVVP